MIFLIRLLSGLIEQLTKVGIALRSRLSQIVSGIRKRSPVYSLPGIFVVNPDPRWDNQRAELMILVTPELLPEVFLDLVEKLGEKIILVIDEKHPRGKSRQMLSFTQPLDARQLHANLAEFADVINRFPGMEVIAQNVEKCCYLMLKPDKSIVVGACNAAPYVIALERRGLCQVWTDLFDSQRQDRKAPGKNEISEERMAQFKQRLEISSCYVSRQSWIN
ncbi:MAG: hypothetical protein ONB44_20525 [candidate division KSB1 bacterium]|nr:hypothetical protein [candidate division KSB1 bacterium]MDZ7304517.1 hypothetical protein [candidate division KSB1 bacterium]MDZ7313897.1 hypothetical protein [candidate division KSB1 bacterium]